MRLDSSRIRSERAKRAWAQEHLAAAAGLALRTIQRAEGTGAASYETARSLAAAFGVEVSQLAAPIGARASRWKRTGGYFGAALAVALAMSALLARGAFAGEIMLDVDLALNDVKISQHRLITEEGEDAELRLEGQMRVFVSPSDTPDGIMLSIRIEEFSAGSFVPAAQPKLLALDNQAAEVRFTSVAGNVFQISIRPHRI